MFSQDKTLAKKKVDGRGKEAQFSLAFSITLEFFSYMLSSWYLLHLIVLSWAIYSTLDQTLTKGI